MKTGEKATKRMPLHRPGSSDFDGRSGQLGPRQRPHPVLVLQCRFGGGFAFLTATEEAPMSPGGVQAFTAL